MRSLLQFLRHARQSHLQFLAGTASSPVYVIGNASADLDSIISAIVYSYCADNRLPTTSPRPHVPLVNLPTIPSGPELYRLRPEFVTALWLSTQFPALRPEERFEETPESAGALLREHIVTVADFVQTLKDTQHVETPLVADATLVDWNAMPLRLDTEVGRGALNGLRQVEFCTLGCIDHHVDEDFMPRADALPAGQPLVIHPGPGSCASLVANELERRGLWAGDADEFAQVAQLALAAVVIDTSNLTAEGKVTGVDVQAVELLRRLVESRILKDATAEAKWDVGAFYRSVLDTKQNSLDLLTLDEILDRDFKDWTETAQSSGERVKLGFCSSVKSIPWIIRKAGGSDKFLDAIRSFAVAQDRQLDVVIIMTAFTTGNDRFCRELFICSVNDNGTAVEGAKRFVSQAAEQLGLVDWSLLDGDIGPVVTDGLRDELNGDSPFWRGLWVQTNVAASRKQVAPLLRTAMANL
ncbi:hypothetical protein N7474_000291 [Penicillium riverlandense]|uniref:uncharacterized protein n=1 Tax=Penicillium riverlandense TaxID=1903569 RepID=UPI0025494A37|nr:uncharacterized protein N7474_000291 [Penicillium riverlandense]KAJ5831980.1 hypothetical protein N7474_000291 [Penicillium riverlandense]